MRVSVPGLNGSLWAGLKETLRRASGKLSSLWQIDPHPYVFSVIVRPSITVLSLVSHWHRGKDSAQSDLYTSVSDTVFARLGFTWEILHSSGIQDSVYQCLVSDTSHTISESMDSDGQDSVTDSSRCLARALAFQ
jgi:hypothetical protein